MDEFDILISGLWKSCAIALLSSALGFFIALALSVWIILVGTIIPAVLP